MWKLEMAYNILTIVIIVKKSVQLRLHNRVDVNTWVYLTFDFILTFLRTFILTLIVKNFQGILTEPKVTIMTWNYYFVRVKFSWLIFIRHLTLIFFFFFNDHKTYPSLLLTSIFYPCHQNRIIGYWFLPR